MNKLLLVGIIVLVFSSNLFAQRYECGEVGGIEEYAIYVDLDLEVACFFDNDSCVRIELVASKLKEDFSNHSAYIFEGKTRASGKIKIEFSIPLLEAQVTEYIGTDSEQTMKSHKACQKSSLDMFDD